VALHGAAANEKLLGNVGRCAALANEAQYLVLAGSELHQVGLLGRGGALGVLYAPDEGPRNTRREVKARGEYLLNSKA
jgi:hypothetical protein